MASSFADRILKVGVAAEVVTVLRLLYGSTPLKDLLPLYAETDFVESPEHRNLFATFAALLGLSRYAVLRHPRSTGVLEAVIGVHVLENLFFYAEANRLRKQNKLTLPGMGFLGVIWFVPVAIWLKSREGGRREP